MVDLLPPEPLNLATRGYLHGSYAIATRGYLQFPDIISRFPDEGKIAFDELFGQVKEELWEAVLSAQEIRAIISSSQDFEATLKDVFLRAKIDQVEFGEGGIIMRDSLNCVIDPVKLLEAVLVDIGLSASLFDGGLQAEIKDEDQSSVLIERPGEGRCKE